MGHFSRALTCRSHVGTPTVGIEFMKDLLGPAYNSLEPTRYVLAPGAVRRDARRASLRDGVSEAIVNMIVERVLSSGQHLRESELAQLRGVRPRSVVSIWNEHERRRANPSARVRRGHDAVQPHVSEQWGADDPPAVTLYRVGGRGGVDRAVMT
jgi:hypothetical protein